MDPMHSAEWLAFQRKYPLFAEAITKTRLNGADVIGDQLSVSLWGVPKTPADDLDPNIPYPIQIVSQDPGDDSSILLSIADAKSLIEALQIRVSHFQGLSRAR